MDPVAVRAFWDYGNIRRSIKHSKGYSYSYSQPLEDLVTQCLKNDKRQRPDVMDILYRTRKGLEGWQDATVPFMRVPADQVPAFMKVAVFQEDSFRTGTLAPERLRKRRAPGDDGDSSADDSSSHGDDDYNDDDDNDNGGDDDAPPDSDYPPLYQDNLPPPPAPKAKRRRSG